MTITHAEVSQIKLRYNVPVSVEPDGELKIVYSTGVMRESAPVAWQVMADGRQESVTVTFERLGEREIGFAIEEYDPQRPLFIDPSLTWNTFLGGSGTDAGEGISVDASGNVYVAGYSRAAWGTPIRPFTPTSGYGDAFVAKLDPVGNLVWHTFLGGSEDEAALAMVMDGSGNIIVTGYSNANWGTPVQNHSGSYTDAFVAKVDSDGNLIWNTFLGGSGSDHGHGITVDGSGNIYVTGMSNANWGDPVRPYSSSEDVLVAKVDSDGNLIWNTFLGGSGNNSGYGITVDGSGNIYVTGDSDATWGDPVHPYTSGYDIIVAKIDSDGNLIWNTFLGGSGSDHGAGIAIDGSGDLFLTGDSGATWGAPLRSFASGTDAFAAKVDNNGSLVWNTFLGGSNDDRGYKIRIGGTDELYLVGYSRETWGSPEHSQSGDYDAFLARLNGNGQLAWNTFQGGTGRDYGFDLALDGNGNAIVTGFSTTTWGSPVRPYTSDYDAIVVKFKINKTISGYVRDSGGIGINGVVMNGLINNTATDSNGFYIGKVDYSWSGGVTPSKWGFSFVPVSIHYSSVIADKTNQNYTALQEFISISGIITREGTGLPNVVIDGLPGNPVTDASGVYTAVVNRGWSGTATPTLAGNSFSPSSRAFSNLTENQTNQDYIATETHTISGVITIDGIGLPNVAIGDLPGNPITDASGMYTATVNKGWSGTATPILSGKSFSPVNRVYSNVTESWTGQDFTAMVIRLTISGYTLTSSGEGIVGVTLAGLPSSPVSEENGFYSATVDYGWSGTVNPLTPGYSFSPTNLTYSNVINNKGNQNYTGIYSTVIRSLPDYYVPTFPVPVIIEVIADPNKLVYAIEESPPPGWSVNQISHGGGWDDLDKKVKWGPFFDQENRLLSYSAMPPLYQTGEKSFMGEAGFDGINVMIQGSSSIDPQPNSLHQSDTNSDSQLLINEITAYGSSWKTGEIWPIGPNPIPLSYVTNAGYIWRTSESYIYDSNLSPPWKPNLKVFEGVSRTSSLAILTTVNEVTNRDLPDIYIPEQPVLVQINVTPTLGTNVFALEDVPPVNWVISEINEGGTWDNINKKVKWGPNFDDSPRSFVYKATPPEGAMGVFTFSGIISIDGLGSIIGGDQSIGPMSPILLKVYLPLILIN